MDHDEINILGFSGSHMSLIFETLKSFDFNGLVRVVMHDDTRYFDAPFDSGIRYELRQQNEFASKPSGKFFFCSNKPSNKQFLFRFFYKLWDIDEIDFISIVHPSSIIASSVNQKGGLYVEPLSVISPYTIIGFAVSINRHCSIGHHNVLHDYCSIYPGSHLTGDVEVGRSATLGPGTTVFSGVRIGENSVVGGGSVVSKDVPPNVLAYGNPCKVIRELTPENNQTIIT